MSETDPKAAMSDAEDAQAEQRRRRRRLALLFAFLTLTACIAGVLLTWHSVSTVDRRFLAGNARCLVCHTELVPELRSKAVHQPFRTQRCTWCHKAHRTPVHMLSKAQASRWRELMRDVVGHLQWDWLRALPRLGSIVPSQAWASVPRAFDRPVVDALRFLPAPAAISWLALEVLPLLAEPETKETMIGKTGPSSLTAAEEQLCWQCHGNLQDEAAMSSQHPPFADGRCIDCHDPHASGHGTLLRGEVVDVCRMCHPMRDDAAMPVQHRPFQESRCIDCHKPHASDHAPLLQAEERELCLGCHVAVAVEDGRVQSHAPFSTGCVECHRPHSSEEARLLQAARPWLCYRSGCHPGTESEFGRASRHPLERLAESCNACHVERGYVGALERLDPLMKAEYFGAL